MSTYLRRKDPLVSMFSRSKELDHCNRMAGAVVGLVTNITDPLGWGRIKIKFPWLNDEIESHWARIAQPYAGKGRGSFWLPEINDEVVVVFENGDPNHPYILGGVWNGKDSVPHDGNGGSGNNFKVWRTRNNHQIIFEDTPGNEKITLVDGEGERQLVIDVPADTITLTADPGDITLETPAEHIAYECANMEIDVSLNSDWKIDTTLSEHCADRTEKIIGPDIWDIKKRWNVCTEKAAINASVSKQSYDKLASSVTGDLSITAPGIRETNSTTIRRRSAPETSTMGLLKIIADNTIAAVTNGTITVTVAKQEIKATDLRMSSTKILALNGGVITVDGKGELTAKATLITLC